MARYIDAEKAVEDARLTHCKDCYSCHGIICRSCIFDDTMSFIEDYPAADVVPKSEVERLENALADKARECNMDVDKICIAHREEIRSLQEAHEAELAAAKREVANEIFEALWEMDLRIVKLHDAIKYTDLLKKYQNN